MPRPAVVQLFDRLQGVLTAGSEAVPYAEVAAQLGMTEEAVQQAASRLRKRYRKALRDEIAATLDDPQEADITSEIRDLYRRPDRLTVPKKYAMGLSAFTVDSLEKGRRRLAGTSSGESAMAEPRYCPVCKALIPEGSPRNLCPQCLLRGVLEDDSGDGEWWRYP